MQLKFDGTPVQRLRALAENMQAISERFLELKRRFADDVQKHVALVVWIRTLLATVVFAVFGICAKSNPDVISNAHYWLCLILCLFVLVPSVSDIVMKFNAWRVIDAKLYGAARELLEAHMRLVNFIHGLEKTRRILEENFDKTIDDQQRLIGADDELQMMMMVKDIKHAACHINHIKQHRIAQPMTKEQMENVVYVDRVTAACQSEVSLLLRSQTWTRKYVKEQF